MFGGKRGLRGPAVAVALAAAIAVTLPAGAAHAINKVDCGDRDDFLKVTGHTSGIPWRRQVRCYANAGTVEVRLWVDQISTGNNDVVYFDENRDVVEIKRWTIMNFPNRPPNVRNIKIL